MTNVSIEQAQINLPQLIADVAMGKHVVITRNKIPVAELIPVARSTSKPVFGSARGLITMAPDFDAPINDFQDSHE